MAKDDVDIEPIQNNEQLIKHQVCNYTFLMFQENNILHQTWEFFITNECLINELQTYL